MRRDCYDAAGLEGRCPGPRAGRHCHRDGVTHPRHVVVSDPPAEAHDGGRKKRLAIEDLDHVFQCVNPVAGCHAIDDTTGDDPRAQRHTDPRTDNGHLEVFRNGVRERIEEWDRDSDGDYAQNETRFNFPSKDRRKLNLVSFCEYRANAFHIFPDLTLR
jgi:hypothetical protein